LVWLLAWLYLFVSICCFAVVVVVVVVSQSILFLFLLVFIVFFRHENIRNQLSINSYTYIHTYTQSHTSTVVGTTSFLGNLHNTYVSIQMVQCLSYSILAVRGYIIIRNRSIHELIRLLYLYILQ
jgi:nitrate/nitrite transporter NarK